MANNENRSDDRIAIQVFELTMDNTEDQDDLNRRLHKPGDPNQSTTADKSSQANGKS